jgi:DNA polymerase-3 subunit alpha
MVTIITEDKMSEGTTYTGPTDFTHLHSHTIFSLLDGVATPNDYFSKCVENKWSALAITEHGVLNSIPDAYFASKQFGIKFVAGCEFYFCNYDDLRKDMLNKGIKVNEWRKNNKDWSDRIYRHRHITILAKNEVGYGNMLALNILAWKDGFYRKPRIWMDALGKHKEGLIVLSGCMNGAIIHEILHDNLHGKKTNEGEIVGAIAYAKKFKEIFGDDFYIELQMPGVENDVRLFKILTIIAQQLKIKTVLTNDCHYLDSKDAFVQKVMMAIDQDTTVYDSELFYTKTNEQYFKTRAQLWDKYTTGNYGKGFSNDLFEKSCDATLEIADKCTTFKINLDSKLPKVHNADVELAKLALAGLKSKSFDKDNTKYQMDGKMVTYREQMVSELRLFKEKDFSSYFLITRNLVKASPLPPGPGRGSAGGSLVCFLIDIHAINPFMWGTSFARFLSPSRGGNMLNVGFPK